MGMRKHPVTEVPHVNGVFEYRGVPFHKHSFRGCWTTYAVIRVEGEHPGSTRLMATTQEALLNLIDKHLNRGGKISD